MNGAYEIVRSSLITRPRLLGIAGLGALVVLIASFANTFDQTVDIVANLDILMFVAITAIYFGSASFGDTVEDETLVYLWASPVSRLKIVAVAAVATFTVVVPASVLVVSATMGVASSDRALLGGMVVAAALSALAYGSVGVFLGLTFKRPLSAGLFYVILWENFIANAADGAAKLSIGRYALGLMRSVAELPPESADASAWVNVLVLLAVAAAGIAGATLRLSRREIP